MQSYATAKGIELTLQPTPDVPTYLRAGRRTDGAGTGQRDQKRHRGL